MTDNTFISQEEAGQLLDCSPDVFNALLSSGLLGFTDEAGNLSRASVLHFLAHGCQWGGGDNRSNAIYGNTSQTVGIVQPPASKQEVRVSIPGVELELADQDTGWIALFFLRPNYFYFPNPSELALIGPLALQLPKAIRLSKPALPTFLFPDPERVLSMFMVIGNPKPLGEPFSTAYDIISPILDDLSMRYDQPLPIAHSFIIGVPSGILTISFARGPSEQILSSELEVFPKYPPLELRDAMALYREGISSNNPFHSFLTLWKTYENACRVRGNWCKVHHRRDMKTQIEVFPELPAFADWKGQSFDAAKQRMNDPYRVALAHGAATKSGGQPRTGAYAHDVLAVSRVVPVIRYMAYVTLVNVRHTLESA